MTPLGGPEISVPETYPRATYFGGGGVMTYGIGREGLPDSWGVYPGDAHVFRFWAKMPWRVGLGDKGPGKKKLKAFVSGE